MIDIKRVDELSDKLKDVNRDISASQETLDALKELRADLERQIREVTSGRKRRAINA